MSGSDACRSLLEAARRALIHAHAPYSGFRVGAALRFADGAIVTGTNVENVSYGISLCAETVAVATAMAAGRRGGLIEVAVVCEGQAPATPCGRCRQALCELAGFDGSDPVIWCSGDEGIFKERLSQLLPYAFKAG